MAWSKGALNTGWRPCIQPSRYTFHPLNTSLNQSSLAMPHIRGPWNILLPKLWRRGAKRTSRLSVKDLPQGPLSPADSVVAGKSDEELAYPTVIQQARNNMRKFPHCVVLTRVGSFYELYFEQATEYAPLLNLKADAVKRTSAGPVPMAGFPFFQLERYLKILVQEMGKYVAIVEEFANEPAEKLKSGGLMFDRRLARIVTPGTLIDESFIQPWENNYLLVVYGKSIQAEPGLDRQPSTESRQPAEVGLAWVDLTSGEFYTQITSLDSLPSVIARINPREVVVDQSLEIENHSKLLSILREERQIITFYKPVKLFDSSINPIARIEGAGPNYNMSDFSQIEVAAATFLLQYLDTQLRGKTPNLQLPVQRKDEEYMMIDKHSVKALELKTTLAENAYEGSLLHAVRRTVTKSGSRLLSQRLLSPSASLEEINERLDIVTEMVRNSNLRERLVTLLRQTFDSPRLVQKFTFGRGDADDLLDLSKTIKITSQIAEVLKEYLDTAMSSLWLRNTSGAPTSCLERLYNELSLEVPVALSDRIQRALDEESVSEQHRLENNEAANLAELAEEILIGAGEEVSKSVSKAAKSKPGENGSKSCDGDTELWIMRKDASKALLSLHHELDGLIAEKRTLEQALRAKSGADSLTLRWNPGKGHICHVKSKDMKKISSSVLGASRHAGSSQSTTSFYVPEWTTLGTNIDQAKLRIRAEENRVFASLREAVVKSLLHLRRNARILDELDVACGFAALAADRNWVRPILNYSLRHHILGGRHPTVEAGLTKQGSQFTSNDCVVGSSVGDSNVPLYAPASLAPADEPSSATAPEEQILLLTGPNMAGKSTYLRQNAIISILAQTGSYVPAAYCSVGIADAIFSRVGSADNLYLSQSTFMLEMLETAHILRHATPRSFVIMDEVGRGTTPEDGIAVSYAALWHLYHRNKCRTLFATHFHRVADMVASWDRVGCWCTDVAEEDDADGVKGWTYVHKLARGVNRQSHALKVARMAGLPPEAIEVAATCLNDLQKADKQPLQPPNRDASDQKGVFSGNSFAHNIRIDGVANTENGQVESRQPQDARR